jgi:hypothetical protein
MPAIFKDPKQDKSLLEKGYVVVDGLLKEQDIRRLKDFALINDPKQNGAFHTTHFSKDSSFKKEVHELITEVVFPRVKHLINGYEPIFGNFMIKKSDASVMMPLHADWCYVDETKSRSLSIWIPLVDTDQRNGCIGVIEGSHTITNSVRGPNIKQSSALEQDAIWTKKYGHLIPMKAGDALIYDHRLLHFSPANASGQIRPAINLSVTPVGVELIHYCIPEGAEQIEKYAVTDPAFYILYDNFQRPQTGQAICYLPKDHVKDHDPRMRFYDLKRRFRWLFV